MGSAYESPWRYRRSTSSEIVEWGDVQGSLVALPMHFHEEDQVTVVLSGRRRFLVGGDVVALAPGEGLAIPAGTPHGSLAEPAGVVCRNAYLQAGRYGLPEVAGAVSRLWRRHGGVDDHGFLDLLRDHRFAVEIAPSATVSHRLGSVSQAAEQAGMSREGFSRAFSRAHGVAPRVFRSLTMLNAGRRLLRAGAPVAAVAVEVGFADQSHFGRCFRRAFGVTPGRYRADWARSHPFQTRSRPGL